MTEIFLTGSACTVAIFVASFIELVRSVELTPERVGAE